MGMVCSLGRGQSVEVSEWDADGLCLSMRAY